MGNTIIETQTVDPTTLLVDANIRSDLDLNKPFIGSIKEYGVLVPIVAVKTEDGLRVRMGHRRTVAAVEAGLEVVPVVIIEAEAEGDAAEIERLLTQHAENHHRTELSSRDEVDVHRQLAAFGLSPVAIARKTKTPKARVDAVLRVAGSSAAEEALAEYQLTLDQAAVLAEFEEDDEAVSELVQAANDGHFDHTAQSLRNEREETALIAERTATLAAQGVNVIQQPSWDSPIARMRSLVDPEGNPLNDEQHATCPGHAVFITVRRNFGDDSAERWNVDQTAVCTDPKANGHIDRHGSSTTRKAAADMSETEREEAKAERRTVIGNNKAWDAATEVRREWVKAYLTRKNAPKEAALFIAQELIGGTESVEKRWTGSGHALLGLSSGGYAQRVVIDDNTSTGRLQVIALGLLLGGHEDAMGRHTWRNVNANTARYLTFLQGQGYNLSEVEKIAGNLT